MAQEGASLPEALREWTDADIALFELGRALGVFGPSEPFNKVKGLFWGDSPLGEALYITLRALVTAGIVQDDPGDPWAYRWNPTQPPRHLP